MISTILKVSAASERGATGRALQSAGVSIVEIREGREAAAAIDGCSAALVLRDGELLPAAEAEALTNAIAAVSQSARQSLPRDVARTLSHELRNPLSAMAGWIHLMETGSLDDAGFKRAITKLRGNIDDQVRTIDRYLGAGHEGR
jgi:signal transduction histidine kinase